MARRSARVALKFAGHPRRRAGPYCQLSGQISKFSKLPNSPNLLSKFAKLISAKFAKLPNSQKIRNSLASPAKPCKFGGLVPSLPPQAALRIPPGRPKIVIRTAACPPKAVICRIFERFLADLKSAAPRQGVPGVLPKSKVLE